MGASHLPHLQPYLSWVSFLVWLIEAWTDSRAFPRSSIPRAGYDADFGAWVPQRAPDPAECRGLRVGAHPAQHQWSWGTSGANPGELAPASLILALDCRAAGSPGGIHYPVGAGEQEEACSPAPSPPGELGRGSEEALPPRQVWPCRNAGA